MENREKVVSAASKLFKERGVDNVRIDDLMAEVGLTRGGFYRMFGSKEQLALEACEAAFASAEKNWTSLKDGDELKLHSLARFYLSAKDPADDCPLVTLSEDVARRSDDDPQRSSFTNGFERLTRLLGGGKAGQSELSAIATLVGARILSKALNDDALSRALKTAVMVDLDARQP